MVLVDTSVWIKFLMDHPAYVVGLDRLLSRNEVVGHDLVYGELLIGDRGGRKKLLDNYRRFHQAETISHAEVVYFVRDRGLHGRGTSWIDIHLLASAVVSRKFLWTADLRLEALAKEVGVYYEVPGHEKGIRVH